MDLIQLFSSLYDKESPCNTEDFLVTRTLHSMSLEKMLVTDTDLWKMWEPTEKVQDKPSGLQWLG